MFTEWVWTSDTHCTPYMACVILAWVELHQPASCSLYLTRVQMMCPGKFKAFWGQLWDDNNPWLIFSCAVLCVIWPPPYQHHNHLPLFYKWTAWCCIHNPQCKEGKAVDALKKKANALICEVVRNVSLAINVTPSDQVQKLETTYSPVCLLYWSLLPGVLISAPGIWPSGQTIWTRCEVECACYLFFPHLGHF